MHRHQEMVNVFLDTFGQTHNKAPTIACDKDAVLRVNLIVEETKELIDSLLLAYSSVPKSAFATAAFLSDSLVGIADACGDLKYVIYGAASTYGLELCEDESLRVEKVIAFGFGTPNPWKATDVPTYKIISIVSKAMEANRWFIEATIKKDLAAVKDSLNSLVDLTYAVEHCCGINMEPIFDEIQRSNMSKVWSDGTVHRRPEDGKIMKPPTYSPADIRGILEKQ